MKQLTTYALVLLFVAFGQKITGQETVLPFADYINYVKTNHPISAQAEITARIGELFVLESRGAFDPELYSQINQKEFEGSRYYRIFDGGIRIPTWYGIEFYSGIEQANGDYLSAQYTLPDNGLTYSGVSLKLGKGLIMDQRRAMLKTAQLGQVATEQERKIILNNLLLDASKAYFQWQLAAITREIQLEGLELAKVRLQAVKQNALLGDIPYIDTLEASIQLQNRQMLLAEAELAEMNTKAFVSTFLWANYIVPLELEASIAPQKDFDYPMNILSDYLRNEIDSLIPNHPEAIKANLKIEEYDIQRKLKLESMKPELNVKYNLLNEPFVDNFASNYTLDNYNWGMEFKMPIFLRSGRGALQIAKLKLRDAELDYSFKLQHLNVKSQQAVNEFQTTSNQLSIYTKTVIDLRQLLIGEQRKFDSGESSLFLVNSRESSYINGRIKLTELEIKNKFALLKISHSLGNLLDDL
jgi:outer membrane protein TolC